MRITGLSLPAVSCGDASGTPRANFTIERLAKWGCWAVLLAGVPAWGQYTISTLAGGVAPATPASALSVSTGGAMGVAVDTSGNFYFTSQLHCVFKVASGTATRVAGTCRPGFSGDGGSSTSAQVNGPAGIAVDSSGNVYIADRSNHRIRKVTSGGTISTVAGNGTAGYSGDNGAALSAQLNAPMGVALDSSGNLYIADTSNHVIRKVSGGTITTIAGTGSAGFSGDGSTAKSAQLNTPTAVAVDGAGNVYIADQGNNRIREVIGANISTVAGNGTLGYSGDNGSATSASLAGPSAVAVDSSNNLYIADQFNSRVRWVSGGIIRTLAGTGVAGFSGDGQAMANEVYSPTGVAVDASGRVYIADNGNNRVRLVSAGTMSTVAGNGTAGFAGDGSSATGAQLAVPAGIARDSAGNLYIADQANHRIRKITAGGTISTIAGTGIAGFSGDGGQATSAQLSAPSAVAVDAAGDVFVADTGNQRIREIFTNGVITTVAGNGTPGDTGDGMPATSAQLYNPLGVAVDASGNLYISDTVNCRIREVIGGTIYTIAGTGAPGYRLEGTATAAQINFPAGIALDGSGNLYIADRFNNRIRKVSSGVISTVAGNGSIGFSGDGGAATSAVLSAPYGVAVDSSGDLFIADTGNNRVRMVSSGGTINTIAGSGVAAFSGDGGAATSAGLDSPVGVAVDGSGHVYVAESAANDVRVLTPSNGVVTVTADTASPSSGSGATQTFALQYSDSNGGGDVAQAWVWINANFTAAANSCMVYYSKASGSIYLLADSGNTWSGPAALGSSGTLSNSQCSVNLGSSSAVVSGTHLTVNLAMTFSGGYAGSKNVYMYATNGTVNSGWQTKGTWTVPSGGTSVTADAVSPSSGSGAIQTFALQYSDSNGGGDVAQAWVWINANFTASGNSCMVYYSKASGGIYLLTDGGNAWSGPAALGSSGTLSNSQCSVNLASSSAVVSGTHLTVNLAMTFSGGYAGPKNIYMYATNGTVNSGWQTLGTWTVPSGGTTGGTSVTADSVSPGSGSGATQTFALQYSDSNGGGDVAQAWVWINANFTAAANSCMAYYSKASGGIYLLADSGSTWSGPAALGSSGTLSNSQCSVNLGSSSAVVSGTHLMVNLAMTFSGGYAGSKNVYMYATNGTVNSGWQTKGTWTVPSGGTSVTADAVSPSSGSGATQTFALQYSDSNGGGDVAQAWVWINANFTAAANSCMVYYSKSSGGIYLLADGGNTWSGPAALGSSGTLSNSQCSVNLGSSSAVVSGTHLTVNLAMTFTVGYAGSKNIYMYGTNGTVNSGWQTRGTWTVP